MQRWDLNSGAMKLGLALKSLQAAQQTVEELWDDEIRRNFHEQYLTPVEPMVRRMLEATHRLAAVLAEADRECGPQY